MNSITLFETGFSECIPLKNLTFSSLPQDKSSVIVIVDKELSGKPESDILYIGRAKKTAKKIIGGYLAGYGGKNTKKINQMLFDECYIEKASVIWNLTDKPRLLQKELLAKFKAEHGEFPSWNAKKKLSTKNKDSPAPKTKKVPALKTKTVAPKVIASSSVKKPASKAKTSSKRSASKEEVSYKTESASMGETDAEVLEKEKAKNETDADNQMAT